MTAPPTMRGAHADMLSNKVLDTQLAKTMRLRELFTVKSFDKYFSFQAMVS
jgi:hypothetical protein